jgi:two-component system OmpR family response regulator
MDDTQKPITETAPEPAPTDVAAPATATEVKPQETGGSQKQILIVEDERPLSHALEMKLQNQGFATKVVTNGQEALAELESGKWSMVLLDLIMPVMDGFALLEEMRAKEISTPAIVLSNLGQDEDRAKAKALGAIDYFVKSNTPIAEIMERVKTALQ